MKHIAHPIGEREAAAFHLGFVVAYALAIWFHGKCAVAHWRDR